MPLESIRTLAKADLEATDRFICDELLSDIPLISQLSRHIFKGGGKRIRPLLVLLTARAFHHQGDRHIPLAAAIELIHTATLLHDDVVDDSDLRRGRKTANSIWGNEASVLVGDFLYSRAFQLLVHLEHPDILGIFAEATNLIAEGEVMQLANRHNPDVTEEAYYDVIQRKTARLFEVATRSGAALCGAGTAVLEAMKTYGMSLGTAYQLVDDLLDYKSSAAEMGKNPGDDLADGKLTLPLIHALRHASHKEADLMRHAIRTGAIEHLGEIRAIVESTGAIRYTALAAKREAEQAIESLKAVPDSPWRDALRDLAGFAIARTA